MLHPVDAAAEIPTRTARTAPTCRMTAAGLASFRMQPELRGGRQRDTGRVPRRRPRLLRPAGCTTSLSGTVYDPAGATRSTTSSSSFRTTRYGALPPITPGTNTCNTCDVSIGNYVAATTTDAKGHFTLTGVPATSHVPLVVQIGKWRREVFLRAVTACTDNAVAPANSRLPKNHKRRRPAADGAPHRRLRRPRLLHEEHGHRRRRVHGAARRRAARHLPGRRAFGGAPGGAQTAPAGARGQLHGPRLPALGQQAVVRVLRHRDPLVRVRREQPDEAARRACRRCTTGSTRAARSSPATTTTRGSRTVPHATSRTSRPGSGRRTATGRGNFAIDTSFPKGKTYHDWLSERGRAHGQRDDRAQQRGDQRLDGQCADDPVDLRHHEQRHEVPVVSHAHRRHRADAHSRRRSDRRGGGQGRARSRCRGGAPRRAPRQDSRLRSKPMRARMRERTRERTPSGSRRRDGSRDRLGADAAPPTEITGPQYCGKAVFTDLHTSSEPLQHGQQHPHRLRWRPA